MICFSLKTPIFFHLIKFTYKRFAKEGNETVKLSEEEQARVCSILCTAEYCMEITQQLEEKLKEKADPSLSSKLDLHAEQDIFHGLVVFLY